MRVLIRELIETVLLALVIYLALQFSVQPYRVEGSSMTPTLQQGEYLLVNKLVYWYVKQEPITTVAPFLGKDSDARVWPTHRPRRGEVIIFRFPLDPSRNFVKRVIGVPGDVVEIRRGKVFVNGEPLEEPYVVARDQGFLSPIQVPPDSYFVLGDNRRGSDDSRHWGPVSAEHIIGRAWISYWPPQQLRELLPF